MGERGRGRGRQSHKRGSPTDVWRTGRSRVHGNISSTPVVVTDGVFEACWKAFAWGGYVWVMFVFLLSQFSSTCCAVGMVRDFMAWFYSRRMKNHGCNSDVMGGRGGGGGAVEQ